MPTTLHIAPRLLRRVDRRADRLKISRNRFIVESIERALDADDDWPPGTLELFAPVDRATAKAVAASMRTVKRRRTTSKPRVF